MDTLEDEKNPEKDGRVSPTSDSSENVAKEFNNENSDVNEAAGTSITKYEGDSGKDRKLLPSCDDPKNFVTNELVQETCAETGEVTSSVVVDEDSENNIHNVTPCKDSNGASNKLENTKISEASNSEKDKTETVEKPSKNGTSRFRIHRNGNNVQEIELIEVIPEARGVSVEDSTPGCTHCEREQTVRFGEVEEVEIVETPVSRCEMFCNFMKKFVDSWWMVGILAALLLWAYSAVYSGQTCKSQCIFLGNVVDLFTFVGVAGCAAAGTRLGVMVFQKTLKKNHFCLFFLVAAETFCFVWAYLVLLVFLVLMAATGDSPTEEQGASYCDPSFYNFMVRSTWSMLGVLIILAFVYISAYSSYLFKSSSEVNIVSSSRYE